MKSCRPAAFTLVELLVVMAIIVALLVLVTPVASNVSKGRRLTQASQMIIDQLSLARQTAISKNSSVEVRFYQYKDTANDPTNANCFRGFQCFRVVTNNGQLSTSPLQNPQYFPITIIMDSGATLSTLANTTLPPVGTLPALPRCGKSYTTSVFRFRADGSTDLDPGNTQGWYLTLHDELKGDALTTPPSNFTTIQINPVNGSSKIYQP